MLDLSPALTLPKADEIMQNDRAQSEKRDDYDPTSQVHHPRVAHHASGPALSRAEVSSRNAASSPQARGEKMVRDDSECQQSDVVPRRKRVVVLKLLQEPTWKLTASRPYDPPISEHGREQVELARLERRPGREGEGEGEQ
eukprot:746889-Hanusia_phi.AAC.5